MNTALLSALREIETDKGIPFETVTGVLEESLLAAYEGREGAERGPRWSSTGRPGTCAS